MRYMKVAIWKNDYILIGAGYDEAVEVATRSLIEKYKQLNIDSTTLGIINMELNSLISKFQSRGLIPSDITIGSPPDMEYLTIEKIMDKS